MMVGVLNVTVLTGALLVLGVLMLLVLTVRTVRGVRRVQRLRTAVTSRISAHRALLVARYAGLRQELTSRRRSRVARD